MQKEHLFFLLASKFLGMLLSMIQLFSGCYFKSSIRKQLFSDIPMDETQLQRGLRLSPPYHMTRIRPQASQLSEKSMKHHSVRNLDLSLIPVPVGIHGLPFPGISAHLLDSLLSHPAQLTLCLGRIRITGSHITFPAGLNLIF